MGVYLDFLYISWILVTWGKGRVWVVCGVARVWGRQLQLGGCCRVSQLVCCVCWRGCSSEVCTGRGVCDEIGGAEYGVDDNRVWRCSFVGVGEVGDVVAYGDLGAVICVVVFF